METKQTMKNIRLLLGEAEALQSRVEIAPEYVPQIDQARIDISAMKGADVIAALLVLNKAGIELSIDVKQRRQTVGRNELSQPPEHRHGHF
jgi:hypothetical protein